MPETHSDVLVVAETQKHLEGLPAVQSTGASLSNYRKILRPLARMTDSWLGMVPAELKNARDGFYPLIRIDEWDAPEKGKTGRLRGLLFLKSSRFFFDNLLVDRPTTQTKPTLILITPRDLPTGCPVATDADPMCGDCPLWMHCATGRLPLADVHFVRIEPFHYRKVCEVKKVWRDAGEAVPRLSFHLQIADTLTLEGAKLTAVPQFEPHYS